MYLVNDKTGPVQCNKLCDTRFHTTCMIWLYISVCYTTILAVLVLYSNAAAVLRLDTIDPYSSALQVQVLVPWVLQDTHKLFCTDKPINFMVLSYPIYIYDIAIIQKESSTHASIVPWGGTQV